MVKSLLAEAYIMMVQIETSKGKITVSTLFS